MKSLWIFINFLFLTDCLFSLAGGNSEAHNKVRHLYREDVTAPKNENRERHLARRVKRAVCGGDIRSSSGEITSPLYPREYPPNTNCTWKIIGTSSERIILVFMSFNLESESSCSYDHVVVYAEKNGVITKKHGPFCGTDTPPLIATEKSNMLINFKTDGSQERTGFRATYRKDVCGGDIRSSSGVITSPLYPRDYLPNTNCTWNIIGSPTERIVLVFTSFNLESSTTCHFDHVLVYTERDGAITRKHGPFCGIEKPPVITSEENNLLINFKTDGSAERSGFSVTYKKEPCGGVFTATEGRITSPQFPQPYPPNKRCTYQIVAPRQHCINLKFTHFELEGNCDYDRVQINSTTHFGTVHQYGRTCGSRAPTNITCEGNKLSIGFKSDNSKEFSGFAADFRMVFAECAVNNGGCKHICNSNAEGKHTCACRAGFVLHPDEHDCKEENSADKIVHFSSVAQPNGSLIFSWRWRGGAAPSGLSGLYFKAASRDHTFRLTLPPTSTNFSADQLRVYKEYEITFWPFYKPAGASDEKLGRPTTLTVHTPASAPTAPAAVTPSPKSAWLGPAELNLTIYGPLAWNSMPGGYRLRWKPADAGDQNEQIINFDETSANAERRNYDLNVTLSLKPGHRYIVFASAFGIGDMGERLMGPETSTKFETIPLAPVNLRAKIVDPTSAMVTWESASPATRYEITVNLQNMSGDDSTRATISPPTFHHSQQSWASNNGSEISPSNEQVPSSMVFWAKGRNNQKSTIWLDGNRLISSNYSLPVFGLIPYRNYEIHIRSCKADACSEKTSKVFRTSPSNIPTAIITGIFSNDTSSIYIEWSFPRPEEWLDLGLQFEVRVYNNGVFRMITTTEMALTIANLTSGEKYEVEIRPSLEVVPGTRKYGNPAKAVVSTWPLVPLPPTLSTKGFENAADVVAISWLFVNSTVLYVEVATNGSDFVNCTALSACEAVVLYGWTSSFKAGFVKISGLNPYEAQIINLRGCNDLGCGDPTTVHVTTGFSEPSEPLGLHLSAEGNFSAILAWEPPLQPGGPLTGYLVSWECANRSAMAATTTECFLVVPGLPTHPQECSFSVSAYHVGNDGEELRGKPATLTTQWPYQRTAIAQPLAA